MFHHVVIILPVSVISDIGFRRLPPLRWVVIQRHGDDRAGALHQSRRVEADGTMVLHVAHPGVAASGEPPVQAVRLLARHRLRPCDAARRESQRERPILYLLRREEHAFLRFMIYDL